MRFKAKPFSAAQVVQPNSDIQSLSYDGRELVVVVACDLKSRGLVAGIEVRFSEANALRYLDEADLVRYWASADFPRGHHVLEVLEGSWAWEESELQGYSTRSREWLIVTGNGCVNVFSSISPEISDTEYQIDAEPI